MSISEEAMKQLKHKNKEIMNHQYTYTKQNVFDNLYNQQKQYNHHKEQMKVEFIADELSKCTFKPHINENSKELALQAKKTSKIKKTHKNQTYSYKPVIEESAQYKQMKSDFKEQLQQNQNPISYRNQKLFNQLKEKNQQEQSSCTFKPQITAMAHTKESTLLQSIDKEAERIKQSKIEEKCKDDVFYKMTHFRSLTTKNDVYNVKEDQPKKKPTQQYFLQNFQSWEEVQKLGKLNCQYMDSSTHSSIIQSKIQEKKHLKEFSRNLSNSSNTYDVQQINSPQINDFMLTVSQLDKDMRTSGVSQ